MTNISTAISDLPPEQRAIRAKCFHPTGRFVEFKKEEIEQSIPDRFEQIVRTYPDRLAVKTNTHKLTYCVLNQTANRVARAILAQSNGGEEPVALLLDHDVPLIATILGVLKAGKIYVPLDPSFPRARVRSMLESLQADLVVTTSERFALAKEVLQPRQKLLNLDEIDLKVSTENLCLPISPDTLVNIIYTSGSTGQPKGAVHNHRTGLYQAMHYTNDLHICPDDRLSLLHSCSFSASVYSLFGALLNGATLLPFALKSEGLAPLTHWLSQEEITICRAVATVLRYFLRSLTGGEKFPKLRLVYVGGEPVYRSDVELFRKLLPETCLVVNMGANETGLMRQHFIHEDSLINGDVVSVGYAVDDKEILLLDESGKEVGFNCVGEIAVRSRYLSRGYWRRPDLTQAAFLPDPEGGDRRIYQTGDLGRMRPDGCLEHLGRKDFQVKIKGQRVELTEVEMALLAHIGIKEVVVTAKQNESGSQKLIAYLVARHPQPTVNELRDFLTQKLPGYMVPSIFVMLDRLPLTESGKLDRQALPDPGNARPELITRSLRLEPR
ncbi:MAG: amino acid adenylation domain-containing protein [Candidatus Binatia bacterium]